MKRCLTSILSQRNAHQDSMRYQFIPIRKAIIKKIDKNRCC